MISEDGHEREKEHHDVNGPHMISEESHKRERREHHNMNGPHMISEESHKREQEHHARDGPRVIHP